MRHKHTQRTTYNAHRCTCSESRSCTMSSSRAQSATNLQMCARCRTSLAHEKRTFAALSQLWFTLQALPSRPQRLLAGATETGPDQAVPMGPGDLGRAVPSCVRACVRACGSWGVRACVWELARARVWELARACARAVTSACPPRYAPAHCTVQREYARQGRPFGVRRAQ